jgi:hypothetical protein
MGISNASYNLILIQLPHHYCCDGNCDHPVLPDSGYIVVTAVTAVLAFIRKITMKGRT